jgi:serine/threonine protein kinase
VPDATPLNAYIASSIPIMFSFFFVVRLITSALRTAKSRPLSVAAIWRLLHSICTTLESLRVARIIHGDIRPQNILVLPVCFDLDSHSSVR